MTKSPVSAVSRKLYIALATLTIISILVSIQPSIEIRQLRNMTILGSFLVGIALLFADKWIRPATVWAIVGLASGLIAFAIDPRPGASTIVIGVMAWPLQIPEVIESIVAPGGDS